MLPWIKVFCVVWLQERRIELMPFSVFPEMTFPGPADRPADGDVTRARDQDAIVPVGYCRGTRDVGSNVVFSIRMRWSWRRCWRSVPGGCLSRCSPK